MKFTCSICGFVYDESKGLPEAGIPAGTKFEDLPADFKCPICGAPKSLFEGENAPAETTEESAADAGELRELTAMEVSILCSNLARGCEKQYQAEQSESFRRLAELFKASAEKPADADFGLILGKINARRKRAATEGQNARSHGARRSPASRRRCLSAAPPREKPCLRAPGCTFAPSAASYTSGTSCRRYAPSAR